jgi:hypothetical protein
VFDASAILDDVHSIRVSMLGVLQTTLAAYLKQHHAAAWHTSALPDDEKS